MDDPLESMSTSEDIPSYTEDSKTNGFRLVSYESSSSEEEADEVEGSILEPEVVIKEEPANSEEMETENCFQNPEIVIKSDVEPVEEFCKGPAVGDYREVSDDSVWEEGSSESESEASTESSEEILLSSDESEISDINENEGNKVKKSENIQRPSKKKKSFLIDDHDLPPIEDLDINVEEKETKCIGAISQIVDSQVVIQAYQNLPAINLDSVLFLDQGKRALGKIFDVFGPVQEPLYVVRFNSAEHVKEKEIEKGALVYFAPETEHTSYVILSDLLNVKGSDASWKDNREPPEKFLDYSDDEEERKAKQARKASRGMKNNNPFSTNYDQANSRPLTPRFRNFSNERYSSKPKIFKSGPPRYTCRPRFGGPPQFRDVVSPFPPTREVDSSLEYYCNTPPPPMSPSLSINSPSPPPFRHQNLSRFNQPRQNSSFSSPPINHNRIFQPSHSTLPPNIPPPTTFQTRPPFQSNMFNRPDLKQEPYSQFSANYHQNSPPASHNSYNIPQAPFNAQVPRNPSPTRFDMNHPPPLVNISQAPPQFCTDSVSHQPPSFHQQPPTFRAPPQCPPQSSVRSHPPQDIPDLSIPPPTNMNCNQGYF